MQAEDGWNYETGFRLRNADESLFLDASVFYYQLNNTIVQRTNADGTEYYVNEGGTNQPGFEINFSDWIIRQNNVNFIRGLQVNESITIDKFSFRGSGRQLTGVPDRVFVTNAQIKFPIHLYAFAQYNYTARLPLDDAGPLVYAAHYNLVDAKIGWEHLIRRKIRFSIYAGANNLLNEKYSLGNDLNQNQIGGRYYNAAALRNYYVGMKVTL